MNSDGLEIAWVVVEEDLWAGSITSTPREEVERDADGLLGLTSNVSGKHTHAKTLRSPESEDNPVADEQSSTRGVVFILDGHDNNRTDESTVDFLVQQYQVLVGQTYGTMKAAIVSKFC